MRVKLHVLLESLLIIAISILWCEVGYYYFVFHFNCAGWPGLAATRLEGQVQDGFQLTKLMLIADTHIMGPIKSVKIDKLRREWQMHQAFKISKSIFEPDVIVFMGDLLDEGSFSRDELFVKACDDFERVFPYDHKQQESVVIPGNHDVGFHDQMKNFPYLLSRFRDKYKSTSSIEIIRSPKTEHLNLVVSNSMSFYNDTCPYCSLSMALTQQLERYLARQRELNPYEFTAPILLGHIPLYRYDDTNCLYPSRMAEKVTKANVEGEDVIHKVASEQILTRLQPRLAISGHTHMYCETNHPDSQGRVPSGYREITISSYNHKYAESKPGFLLMTANSTHVFTEHCNLVEEWIIVSVYIAAFLTVLFRLIFMHRARLEDEIQLSASVDEE